MKNMLLKDPERMMELFTLLHKTQSNLYQEKELNEAINNALLLENEEHSILTSSRYSIEDVLYGRFYWYTKFLCCYEAIYGKTAAWSRRSLRLLRLWTMRESLTAILWKP